MDCIRVRLRRCVRGGRPNGRAGVRLPRSGRLLKGFLLFSAAGIASEPGQAAGVKLAQSLRELTNTTYRNI